MTGEVIKSFLVGLGFDVDDSSFANFNKAIASATLKVTALYASINVAAAAIGKGITSISEDFEQLGYEYKIIAPAINKAIMLRQEMFKAYSAAGVNLTKVVQASVKLNLSITKTKYALDAIYKSVGSRFFELLTKQSDTFRKKLYENMPKIQAGLEKFIKFIFKSLEAVTTLGIRLWSILGRVYDFFATLDKATDGWSTIILGVIAAWKLLNLSFLASPLGILLSLGVALLALWDDFKTFQEGGKSLINWGSDLTKTITGLVGGITAVVTAFYAWNVATKIISQTMKTFETILAVVDGLAVVLEAPIWLIVAAVTALVAALTLADAKWQIFGGHLSGFFSGVGGKIMDFFGGLGAGGNVAANLQNNPVGSPLVNPVGSNVQNSSNNQNVNQQTQINVMGSADANAVGKSVAGEQNRVNFDMVRNLKGATR